MDDARSGPAEIGLPLSSHTVRVDLAAITRVRTLRDGTREIEAGSVRGWAVCPEALERIDVLLSDRLIATARIGDIRPDVAAIFPHIPHAEQAGFEATLTSGRLPPGTSDIVLRLKTVAGRSLTISHPLTIAEGAIDPAQFPIRMALDHCTIDALGRLHLSGWAVAMTPIVAIQVFISDARIATTTPNRPRPDVAMLLPSYPNSEQPGFELVRQLSRSERTASDAVRVEVIARDGSIRSMVMPACFEPAGHATPALPAPAPRHHAELHFNCDAIALETSGTVQVSGWVAAQAGVARLSVFLGETLLGEARLGLARPDVGRAFPRFPDARKAGFTLSAAMPGPLQGDHRVRFDVTLKDGSQRRFMETATAADAQAEQPQDGVMLAVDGMQIEAGHAARQIKGAFHLVGWAVARAGVDNVEVFVDDQPIGRAYHGIRREDVGTAFPQIPNALRGGFALSIPSRALKTGRSRFRVVTTGRDGAQAELSFTVDIDTSQQGNGIQALRSRMSGAELATHLAILDARGPHPLCDLALRLPVGRNTAQQALATLASLASQPYENWRLWLAPAAKRDGPALRAVLIAAFPEHAGRILDLDDYRKPDGPALAGLLSAGDTLAADALFALALAASGPNAGDLVYGDDRRPDGRSGELAAFFKPGWSPDLLLSQNYIGRASLARSDALDRAGLDLPAIAAQGEYAALLRLTENATSIRHLPQLILEAAGAQLGASAELRALSQALKRRQISATAEAGRTPALHRIRHRSAQPGKVSIIIPSIGAKGHVRACLESIRSLTRGVDYEIIIVDNVRERGLSDAQRAWKTWFRANADVVVPVDAAFNWSRLNNLGAAAASGDYLLFLNDDTEVLHEDWLAVLTAEAARPEVGAVGAQLLYPDGKVQHAGMFLSRAEPGTARHAFRFADQNDPGYFGLALSQRNVSSVTGACMMLRRDVFDTIGGFDEAHRVVNNNVDLCLRLHRAGKLIVYTPHARLIHHELASRATLKDTYDKSAFLDVWGDLCLAGDPFHNPNISSEVDDYAIEEEPIREVYAGHPLDRHDGIKRILVVKLDHIGDFVTALPAFRRLKSHFPQARIEALVGRSAAGIARLEGAIDDIIPFDFFNARSSLGPKRLRRKDYAALGSNLKSRRFDLAIDLRKLGDTRHILQHAHAPLVAGFDQNQRFPWLDIALEWERDALQLNKRNHVADDLLNLVDAVANAFGEDRRTIQPNGPLPALSDELREEFGELFAHDYVVVHPAAGTPLRQWPPAHFARLIDLLVEQDGLRVALIGGPDERKIAEAVLAQTRRSDAVFDLVGRSRLNEVPEIMARSVLFVGNNSGPSHIASGLGVPTVAVHSAIVASEEWAPLGPAAVALRRDMSCAPCYIVNVKQCHRSMACLTSLTPQAVHAICQRFLSLRVKRLPALNPAQKHVNSHYS